MTGSTNEEIEVKFHVRSLPACRARLEALGARVTQARVLERNVRYDTAGGDLRRAGRVLRVRQDAGVRLTYKGPGEMREGVQCRTEIELSVDSFDQARAFVEALGYQVAMAYEKYRATYAVGDTLVTLDELPFGSFVEVEGRTPELVAEVAKRLGLDWSARINESYVHLFERAREALGMIGRDLAFEDFKGVVVGPRHLGTEYAG